MPPNGVLVLDQVPYHRTLTVDSQPARSGMTKAQMADWLLSHGVTSTREALLLRSRSNLYELCQCKRPKPVYAASVLATKYQVEVLFLPVSHPELNPIELAWARIKRQLRERNVDFNVSQIMETGKSLMDAFTAEQWRANDSHARKYEDLFQQNDDLYLANFCNSSESVSDDHSED